MSQEEIDKIIDELKYQYWTCHDYDEDKVAQIEWELDYFYWLKENN